MSFAKGTFASRSVALGLLALLIAGLYVFLAAPVLASFEQSRADLTDLSVQKAKLLRSIGNLKLEDAELSNERTEGMMWRASRAAEVSALVQAQLGRLAKAEGVTPRSIAQRSNAELFGQAAVTMSMELEAPLEVTVRLLRSIESHSPILAIDAANLRVRSTRVREGQAERISSTLTILAPFEVDETEVATR